MSARPFISILVAEDNDVSRQLMTGILEVKGYRVWGAVNGESAIKVVQDHDVDLALVDVNMAPTGGFDFVRYLVAKGIDLPVVLVTGDDSGDLLLKANDLGVAQVMQKPVTPERLLQTVGRILTRRGLNPDPLAVGEVDMRHDADDLMHRVIEMAAENVRTGRGQAFAALVADREGKILGTGANAHASRFDPAAHAEVMAIRQAAERLGRADLEGCVLYCSSRPTKIGVALIESVGIAEVCFGLEYADTGLAHKEVRPVSYRQLCRDEALTMFKQAQK